MAEHGAAAINIALNCLGTEQQRHLLEQELEVAWHRAAAIRTRTGVGAGDGVQRYFIMNNKAAGLEVSLIEFQIEAGVLFWIENKLNFW